MQLELARQTTDLNAAFWAWFGESRIRNKDGTPRMMYHGTAADFKEFRGKQAGAIFLTDDPKFAESFSDSSQDWLFKHASELLSPVELDEARQRTQAEIRKNNQGAPKKSVDGLVSDYLKTDEWRESVLVLLQAGPHLMPLFVRCEDPFDWEDPDHIEALDGWREAAKYTDDSFAEEYIAQLRNGSWDIIERPEIQRAIRTLGHDGFWIKEGGKVNLAVYNPNQVKAAYGNDGHWSRTRNDITARPQPKFEMPDTPQFKRFFGKSVVDQAVFHLAKADFEEFNPNLSDLGIHFGTKEQAAARGKFVLEYDGHDGTGMNTRPCWIRIEKPLRLEDTGGFEAAWIGDQLVEKGIVTESEYASILQTYEDEAKQRRAGNKNPVITDWDQWVRKKIQAHGYDGVVYANHDEGDGEDSWIVFDPKQVKSAIGNDGNYDPNSSYITATPAVLYHSTSEANAAAILKGGLKIECDQTGYGAIFLSSSPPLDASGIVLQVRTNGIHLEPDPTEVPEGEEWYVTWDDIPASHISIWQPESTAAPKVPVNSLGNPVCSPQAVANFKAWFGRSKVVDEQKRPLVLYHGTPSANVIRKQGFSNQFLGTGNDQYGAGFYFTAKADVANGYKAGGQDRNTGLPRKVPDDHENGVLDIYLSIQKPIIIKDDGNGTVWEKFPPLTRSQADRLIRLSPESKDPNGPLANYGDIGYSGRDAVIRMAVDTLEHSNPWTLCNDFYDGHEPEFLRRYSTLTGYDGVFVQPTGIYVAWFPRQIKTVDNDGTFSETDQITASETIDSLISYWSQRTWPSEDDAREHIRRRLIEDNERYPMFKPSDPAVVDQLQFVKVGKQVRLKGTKPHRNWTPVSNPFGDTEPIGNHPEVDWEGRDLEDDGTPDSILRLNGGKGRLYKAWVSPSDLPTPKGEDITNGVLDWDSGVFDELKHHGRPPAPKILINRVGRIRIVDGNHRIAFWAENDMDCIPVWVIDERPAPKEQSTSEWWEIEMGETETSGEDDPVAPLDNIVAAAKKIGVDLEVSEDEDAIAIEWISSRVSRTGEKIIRLVINYARTVGKPVILDAHEGKQWLIDYYSRIGFKPWTAPLGQFGCEWKHGMRFDTREQSTAGEDDPDGTHRQALQKTGFWGRQGAGCILVARNSGRICIGLRSQGVLEPGTWGTWGGALDPGLKPEQGALAELIQETRCEQTVDFTPLLVFQKGTFRYFNFLAQVDHEFEPKLDWENDGFRWVDFGDWPRPLHPGLKALLDDKPSLGLIERACNREPVTKKVERAGVPPMHVTGVQPSDARYAYHATSIEAFHDIVQEGLRVHEPWEYTDQNSWPDGKTEKRSYFAGSFKSAMSFFPDQTGWPVMLRIRKDRFHLEREQHTGDMYSRELIPAEYLEYLGEDDDWHNVLEAHPDALVE